MNKMIYNVLYENVESLTYQFLKIIKILCNTTSTEMVYCKSI